MKKLIAVLLVLGALTVGSSSGVGASTASARFGTASFLPHFGAGPTLPTGKALHGTSSFTCGSITCAAYEAGVNGYVQDVAADSGGSNNVYSVATEYSDSTGSVAYDQSFGGTFEDTHSFPASGCPTGAASACLTEAQLVTEMKKDMTTKGWTPSGSNLFVILLPGGVDTCIDGGGGFCASNTFCAYHDYLGGSGSLIFAVEPFNAAYPCNAANEPTNPQGFPNGPEIDEEANTLSHETNESVTDPYGNGWWSAQGEEDGDLCAWWFGAPLGTVGAQPYNQVINGHQYSLQQEFSNSTNSGGGGCLQHAGGTPSTASPYVGDSGPLTYHGGSVMRSAHVYTIYWIPGPTPELSTAPVIKGKAAVAQTLSTTSGTWANSPTSFSYKWLRCDSSGSNCVPIQGATKTKYTVLSGDAGHEIRSIVKASNANGPADAGPAQSDPTVVVVASPKVVTLPMISGTPQAGMTLSVSTGTWTYSPTGYAYQWLRCSAAGSSCTAITHATKANYTLTSADAGHTLVAKVTASNAAGKRTATTATTGVVTS